MATMHGDLEADREVAHARAAVIPAGLPGRISASKTAECRRVLCPVRTRSAVSADGSLTMIT